MTEPSKTLPDTYWRNNKLQE